MNCYVRYIYLLLLYGLSIHAMNYQENRCAMILLSSDIIQREIQPLISYQCIGRLKQCSTSCNTLYDTENMCLSCSKRCHTTYGCQRLAANYYACSKALGHYACIKDERMFAYLWQLHARHRDPDKGTLAEHMVEYRRFYDTPERIKQDIISHVSWLLHIKNDKDLGIILSGSNVDIIGSSFLPELKTIMHKASQDNKLSFVNDVCFGVISIEDIVFMMPDISPCLIERLIDVGILDINIVDKFNNTLLHSAVAFERGDIIPVLLKKGIYVNVRNKKLETPLHYAVERHYCDSVIELLTHPDINTKARNMRKKKASFYVSKRRMLSQMYSSEEKNRIILIRNMLKQHAQQRDNSNAQRNSGKKYKTLK